MLGLTYDRLENEEIDGFEKKVRDTLHPNGVFDSWADGYESMTKGNVWKIFHRNDFKEYSSERYKTILLDILMDEFSDCCEGEEEAYKYALDEMVRITSGSKLLSQRVLGFFENKIFDDYREDRHVTSSNRNIVRFAKIHRCATDRAQTLNYLLGYHDVFKDVDDVYPIKGLTQAVRTLTKDIVNPQKDMRFWNGCSDYISTIPLKSQKKLHLNALFKVESSGLLPVQKGALTQLFEQKMKYVKTVGQKATVKRKTCAEQGIDKGQVLNNYEDLCITFES